MARVTVLIVEDNRTEQHALKALLEQFDYDADAVSSGEDAVNSMAVREYAAVLMDISLPGMDGYDCTKRIREIELERGLRTPIIALTARSEQEDRDAAIAADMDDYMSKPFDPEELRRVLLRWLYDPRNPNVKILSGNPEADFMNPH
jgi:CheY-like chemotaxis protein